MLSTHEQFLNSFGADIASSHKALLQAADPHLSMDAADAGEFGDPGGNGDGGHADSGCMRCPAMIPVQQQLADPARAKTLIMSSFTPAADGLQVAASGADLAAIARQVSVRHG